MPNFDYDPQPDFKNAQKMIKRGFIAVLILWVLGFLVSLSVTGVIIWAVIKVVAKYTA